MKYFFLGTLVLLPVATYAQNLQSYVVNFTSFLGNIVVPFLLGIGFLFFAFNAIRFFVVESANEEGREKAKSLAIYGVMGFVFVLVFWGILNLIAGSTGLDNEEVPPSDYTTL